MATVVQDTSRFWADGFDVDLLSLQPNLREIVGPIGETPLWTLGSMSDAGVFAHPCCWNAGRDLAAFFWASEPTIERDAHGWASIYGYTASEPLCRVTLLQVIRDCWLHNYCGYLLRSTTLDGAVPFVRMTHLRYTQHFHPMMAHVRGWNRLSEFQYQKHLADAEDWAAAACRLFERVLAVVTQ